MRALALALAPSESASEPAFSEDDVDECESLVPSALLVTTIDGAGTLLRRISRRRRCRMTRARARARITPTTTPMMTPVGSLGDGGGDGGDGGDEQVATEPETPVRVVAQEQKTLAP